MSCYVRLAATNHGITVNKENPLLLPEEKEEVGCYRTLARVLRDVRYCDGV